MSYKEFYRWCMRRAHDGCWGYSAAICSLSLIKEIQAIPFWKREKKWKEYEHEFVSVIVKPTNDKIRELLGEDVKL